MNEWQSIAALSVAVALVVYSLVRLMGLFFGREREEEVVDSAARGREPVFGPLTEPMAKQLPLGEESQSEIDQLLVQAGYYSRRASTNFHAIRYAMVLFPILCTGLVALLVDRSQIPIVLIIGAIATAIGFSLPRLHLDSRAKQRRRQYEQGLPVATDLLSVGLMSGQTINSALARVANEIRRRFPALSEELDIVRFQTEISTLTMALKQWARRVQMPEVNSLVTLLTQSERQGVDITEGLFEHAATYRAELRQRAEAQANRASVWLVFPTIFCLWLPAAMILVGPILFELRERRIEAAQFQQEIQQQVSDANLTTQTPITLPSELITIPDSL